ncbi:coenzyme F420-0:L-glutamate ligase [Actinacidiphila yeochonensis]|uniref:coenzyme F420-0:L-glutamate ligase n=1 Tax=Actinacidiphila yeochonensis TaxID=89050 RepID=UPI0018E2B97C|nr:coenzyme F420-0:L-glutamate ligase [Actinacidiphila yeochonensis]
MWRSNGSWLLPANPDTSARALTEATGADVAVVIADSDGRADRRGATVISIAAAGITPLQSDALILAVMELQAAAREGNGQRAVTRATSPRQASGGRPALRASTERATAMQMTRNVGEPWSNGL